MIANRRREFPLKLADECRQAILVPRVTRVASSATAPADLRLLGDCFLPPTSQPCPPPWLTTCSDGYELPAPLRKPGSLPTWAPAYVSQSHPFSRQPSRP